MYEKVEKPKESESRAVGNCVGQRKGEGRQGFVVLDKRVVTGNEKLNEMTKSKCNIIQCKVPSARGKGRWYSTYDPFKEFSTKALAQRHDQMMKKQGREETNIRVPTLYTYTHTKPDNVLTKKQGPHTAAHKILVTTFRDATDDDLYTLFIGNITKPNEYDDIIDTQEYRAEFASGQMYARIARAKQDYKLIYDQTESLFGEDLIDRIAIIDGMNKLLNMDPYATYGWWTTKDASKKNIAGKAEAHAKSFEDLHDKGGKRRFKNQTKYNERMKKMKEMYDTYM